MNLEEAIAWAKGKRSMTNIVPELPFETWQVRTAEADAAMMQQAYWVLRSHNEKLVPTEV